MAVVARETWMDWVENRRVALVDSLREGSFWIASIALPPCAVIAALILVALWITFVIGLPSATATLSLENYWVVFSDVMSYKVLLNTAIVAVGTTAVSLFFGIATAWLVQKTDLPGKTIFITLMALGITIPGFLKGIAWILLLSPKIGLINKFLVHVLNLNIEEGPLSIYNLAGISFIQGLMLTPVVFFMLFGAMQALDPSLEESAEVFGASRFTTLRRVTLPLLLPGIAGVAIYNMMTGVHLFEIPALLGAPNGIHVLSTMIFFTVHTSVGLPNYGVAGVYGVLLTAPMVVALYFYYRVIRASHRYRVVTGKGYRAKLMTLGKGKYLGLLFVLFYNTLALFLPFLALVWVSLTPYIRLPSAAAWSALSLSAYAGAFHAIGGWRPIRNTLLLMTAVPVIVMTISLMMSWVVVRTRMQGRQAVDVIAMLPHAIPGLVFAFALAVVAMSFHRYLPIYGTLFILILANAVNKIAYGTRVTNASLVQLHEELKEAAEVCGASKLTVIRKIFVPILAPSLLFGGLWVSLLAFREVTMALMLQSPRNAVVPVAIWNLWGSAHTDTAAALGVIIFLVMGTLTFALQKGAAKWSHVHAIG